MAKDDFKFRRGEPLVDLITGFRGFVTARQDHITRCNCYYLEPKVDEKGELKQGQWFDENCLAYDRSRTKIILDQARDQPPG